jgi:D-threo-aldose 1-dehydrogenase
MQYKPIGETGISLPPVIFGTSALGNLYAAIDRLTKKAIVENCFNAMPARPVVFDSAGKYGAGLALKELGKCLQESKIDPQDVIISNKLGWLQTELKTPEPTFEKGVWFGIKHDAVQDISYEGIWKCWEQGNVLLGGKYKPAMVSVHDPDEFLKAAVNSNERKNRFRSILDAYKALFDLKAEGYVKSVGIGSKDWQVIRELAGHVSFDWVMFANSFTIMNHPADLLEFMSSLQHQDISIINSAVFHGGFLTGSNYYDYRLITPETDKPRFLWREEFLFLCNKYAISPATACVNFGMTPPGVVAISLNTSNPLRVKDNIASVTEKVPKEFYAEMVAKGLISSDYPYLGI